MEQMTLERLEKMTPREIVDYVAVFLKKQGRKSESDAGGSCFYRRIGNDRVLMCGVGCLIPDDLYDERLERKDVTAVASVLVYEDERAARLGHIFTKHRELLETIQHIHDNQAVEEWPLYFTRLRRNLLRETA